MAKIFGHQKPDTDSICSSIAFGYLLNEIYDDSFQVCRLGDINEETKYILDKFGIEKPILIDEIEDGEDVYLIDHNEFPQSVKNIDKANIKMVVDHHRLDNFHTVNPIEIRMKPVGCSSTILFDLFKENNVSIPKKIASLMLSAIISDTMLFKSPTTTEQDQLVASYLMKIADLDVDSYGLEMLKAGTNLSGKNAKELLEIDAKEFTSNSKRFEVAQINTVDIDELLLEFETQLKAEMQNKVDENKLNLFLLMVTDIVNSNSMIVAIGEDISYFNDKFNVQLEDGKVLLRDVVSRKKQIVPFL